MPLPVVYIVAVTAVACLNSFLQIPSTTTCVRQVIHRQDLIIIILLLLLLLLEIQHLTPLSCTHSLQLSRDLLLIEVTHTRLTALYPGLPGWASTRKAKPILDFTETRDSEWQWHQLGHMQVCTSLQTDNHASTPPLSFCRPDALPVAQPTASKHWRPFSEVMVTVTQGGHWTQTWNTRGFLWTWKISGNSVQPQGRVVTK